MQLDTVQSGYNSSTTLPVSVKGLVLPALPAPPLCYSQT